MPKIQKHVSRKIGEKKYFKYVLTIPIEILKKQGIEAGDEVEISLKKVKIN